jgi:FAD/FMN-containing dehydrogenase
MNRIIDLDTQSGVLTCEAGCILEAVTHEVEKQGFLFPLDLGAKGSCMIGGNLSTNAGGLRVVKYGNLHGSVVGLEVVRADGTIVDMTSTLRKDNCGYQLMHLFVGSEGTLGVITKANILLAHKPLSSQVLLAKLSSFKSVSKLLSKARSQLGDNLTAFEFMDANSISTVRRETPALLHNLFPTVLPSAISEQVDDDAALVYSEDGGGICGEVSVLIESTGTAEDLDRQRVDRFVELILEEGLVVDAVLSQSTAQERELWAVREHIPVALAKLAKMVHATTIDGREVSRFRVGKLFKFDLSVNLKDTDAFIKRVRDGLVAQGFRLKDDRDPPSTGVTSRGGDERSSLLRVCELEVCTFGHIADQNIHLNILATVDVVERSGDGADALDGRCNDTRCFIMSTLNGDPIDADFSIRYNGSDCSIVVDSLSDDIVRSYWMALQAIIDETVFSLTNIFRGSISAEHGVGQQKKSALLASKPPEVIRLMRDMKRLMDPNCILNPGKVIDL